MSEHELLNIPVKAHRILNIILGGFLLIILRLWHLSVNQHEERLQESRLPGKRTEIEMANRGTIRDRFNEPLALNKLKYQAAILYSNMKPIPSVAWEVGPEGKKIKVFKKKEYIKNLSNLLADTLKLDSGRIEDEIHAKASQFYNVPFVIKENLTEEEYYRLKILGKDWPGLIVKKVSERVYPKGKVASDIIGYLGAIGKGEYEAVIREREELKLLLEGLDLGADLPLPENYQSLGEVKKRLKELEELAYTAADSVGKTGIEAQFEEDLRGLQGKKTFFTDSSGHKLREYPGGRRAVPGKRLLLSISSELQEFSEKLLALSEETRDTRVKRGGHTQAAEKSPWIKGGGIIALDPHTGEVLTLASYPRFDPNDFNQKKEEKIHTWLEHETAAGAIWNGQIPLTRERYDLEKDLFWDEEKTLTWELFLDLILSKESEIKKRLLNLNIENGLHILRSDESDLQLLDLLTLALDERLFSPQLLKVVGKWTIQDHRLHEQAFSNLQKGVEEIVRGVFKDQDFSLWRQENEKAFILEKRLIEQAENKYPKPYLDYLDEEEKKQFIALWEGNKNAFIYAFISGNGEGSPYTASLFTWRQELEKGAHPEMPWTESFKLLKKVMALLPQNLGKEYLSTLRTYSDLTRPLRYPWKISKKGENHLLEKHLAKAFYPTYGWGFGRSHVFRQATIQGSIFKLIVAYTALIQKWNKNESLNFLEIEDRFFKVGSHAYVGKFSDGKHIPQLYKGGRIPRSHALKLGKMDLYTALELSSNPYFAITASDIIEHPHDLLQAASKFSYGSKTGIDLPFELSGKLPTDLDTNMTGLFATAIGQHNMTATPLQTAVMLSSLANGGKVLKPQILTLRAGKKRGKFYEEVPFFSTYPFKKELYLAGIDFPLIELPPSQEEKLITKIEPEIKETVFFPETIQNILLEGMRRVIKRQTRSSLISLSRIYKDYPEFIADFVDMKNLMIGKTSTSEALERLDLDQPDDHPLYTHVWFGGISYDKQVRTLRFVDPDIVIVVYLRYGGFGNESAPLAAQIAKKWREIKLKHR